jgi:hypothetical protein
VKGTARKEMALKDDCEARAVAMSNRWQSLRVYNLKKPCINPRVVPKDAFLKVNTKDFP